MPRILEKLPPGGFNNLEMARVRDTAPGEATPAGAKVVPDETAPFDWTPLRMTPFAAPDPASPAAPTDTTGVTL